MKMTCETDYFAKRDPCEIFMVKPTSI